MFLILSKITAFLIMPFFWIWMSCLLAFFIKKWRKRLLIFAAILFLVFSNQAVFSWVVGWWEKPLKELNMSESKALPIVVVGGYCAYNHAVNRTRFTQSSDRLWQSLLLKNQTGNQPFILSGGSANVFRNERGEGAVVYEALKDMGISLSQVYVDSISRNTYENGVETSKIFEKNQWPKHIILVTSSWHMPRASRCFQKQGFEVVEHHTDHLSPTEPLGFGAWILPSASTLGSWELLIREWVGLIVYKIKGYV